MLYRLGAANDDIHATSGNDMVYGKVTAGGSLLYSGGVDRVSTGKGDDRIRIYTDSAKIAAGAGDDLINLWVRTGSGSDNVVHGNAGDDRIQVRIFNDASVKAFGESGDDTFVYIENLDQTGTITLDGGTGNDRLLLPEDGDRETVVAGLTLRSVETLALVGSIRIAAAQLDPFTHVDVAAEATLAGPYTITIDGPGSAAVAIDHDMIVAARAGTDLDFSGSTGHLTINLDGRESEGGGDVVLPIALGADVTGGDADDTITATGSSDDTLSGSAGNDTLDGGGGNNHLSGGAGDDTFVKSDATSTNVFDGGDGSDFIAFGGDTIVDLADGSLNTGGAAGDTLISIEGVSATNVYGDGADNDLAGNLLYGRGGDDTLSNREGQAGDMYGGDGDDMISAQAADVFPAQSFILDGGTGNDTLGVDGGGIFAITGGDGNDVIAIGNSDVDHPTATIDGGAGDDILRLSGTWEFGGDYTFNGGEGSDTIDYSEGYFGYRPRFTIDLAESNPSNIENIIGNSWIDTLSGNEKANLLSGLGGADILTGRAGDDTLLGGNRNDTLDGGVGKDTIDGGDGIDTLTYASAGSGVRADLQNGYYNNKGDADGDKIRGVENLVGSAFGDSLRGNSVANRIEGGDGDDYLYGRAGNDTLVGGAGIDHLEGGKGADRFVLIDSTAAGRDIVTDFANGTDKFDVTGLGAAFADIVIDAHDLDGDGKADDLTITWGSVSFDVLNLAADKIDKTDFLL